jgi:MFS family permease
MMAAAMKKRQLVALCLCIGLINYVGTANLGLLPVYAVRLGADPATTGFFLAFNFFITMLGTLTGGWLSDHLGQRKRILLISYAAWIPAALLMTQATDILGLAATLGMAWFPGGIALAMVNSITALSAPPGERGKVFGWLALAAGIGGMFAGIISGRVVDRWDFPALFVMMSIGAAAMLVIATFIEDRPSKRELSPTSSRAAGAQTGFGRVIYLLLLANLLARLGLFTSDLGRPLAMTGLHFDATAISSAIGVSNAFNLPLPLLVGWLSDRVGRKRFLVGCYGLGAAGIFLLIPAAALWQFWLSASLAAVIITGMSVTQATVADRMPPEAMGKGMSMFNTSSWIAGMVGLSSTGYLIQTVGMSTTLLLGALLPIISIALVTRLRRPDPVPSPA